MAVDEATRKRRAAAQERTRSNGGIAPIERHGTAGIAKYWGCKCPECVAAVREYLEAGRLIRFQQTLANGGIAPVPAKLHGNYSTAQNWNCKCPKCLAARASSMRNRRRRNAERGE